MIIIDNISKKFLKTNNKKTSEFYAVNNISLNIEEGKIYGILGQNGAGKTTLLRMIAGIMTPTSGSVTIDGLNYQDNAEEIKKDLAFLSGNTKLYENITPKELLSIFGQIYGINKKDLNSRITKISNLLDMKDFIDSKIGNLSTGQIQRTNIARCFLHDPKYYILDEATTGLDVMSSQIIIDFIKEEKKRGKTIIYSTHYMEEAENICDEIMFINKGKEIIKTTPEKAKKITKTSNLRDAFFKLIGGNNGK